MAKVTTSYANWNFHDNHVQQNLLGGDFVGSHSIIICASAPRISYTTTGSALDGGQGANAAAAGGASGTFDTFNAEVPADAMTEAFAIPIGVVDSFQTQQARQLQQVFEIGSKRSYILTARNITTLALTRVLYHGPSLLRMMYAYYPTQLLRGLGNDLKDLQKDNDTKMGEIALAGEFKAKLPKIADAAGHDSFFINLASDLFSQPIGLVMYVKDNNGTDVGACFFEECLVENHGFGISQGAVIVAEQCNIRCERVKPMRVNVTRSTTAGGGTQTSGNSPAGGNIRPSVGAGGTISA